MAFGWLFLTALALSVRFHPATCIPFSDDRSLDDSSDGFVDFGISPRDGGSDLLKSAQDGGVSATHGLFSTSISPNVQSCYPALDFTKPSKLPKDNSAWWCDPKDEFAFMGFSYEVTACTPPSSSSHVILAF
jgi:hypothetical protein